MAREVLGYKPGAHQHRRGDQANQAVVDERRVTDVSKIMLLLHIGGDSLIRKALQRVHQMVPL